MKTIHRINIYFYLFTIVLYASVYLIMFGAYSQIALGFVQIISAIIITSYWKVLSNQNKNHLLIYWFLAITNLTLIYSNPLKLLNSSTEFIILFITPMCIASYFVYITYLIQKK